MIDASEQEAGAGGGGAVMDALEVRGAARERNWEDAGPAGDDDRVMEAVIKACSTPVAYICMGMCAISISCAHTRDGRRACARRSSR